MKAELEKIFNLYEEFKEAGQAVTLTLASRGGKSTVKLQLESSTSSSSPSPAQPSPPAPGQRRRNCGPRQSGDCRYLYHQGNEQTTGSALRAAARPWFIPAGK